MAAIVLRHGARRSRRRSPRRAVPRAARPVQGPGRLRPTRRDPADRRRQAPAGRAPRHPRSNPAHRTGVPRMTPAQDDAPSGRATDRGNAASTAEVRAMFDRIARVYDPMNLVISAFQEPRWRKRAVKLSGRAARAIGCSTWRPGPARSRPTSMRRAQPGGSVLGVDISPAMIRVATAAVRRPARARVRRRRRARPADRGRHVRRGDDRLRDAQPARLRQGVRRDGPLGPARAGASSASRSPGRRAGPPASSSSGSTGSCRSSAGSPARAARTATSSAASRATRARTGSPRSCARSGSQDVTWQRHVRRDRHAPRRDGPGPREPDRA